MQKIFIISIILYLFSCGYNAKPEKPQNIISEDTLKLILIDMHLAGSIINNSNETGLYQNKLKTKYTNDIFKKYHIDSIIYDSTIKYYSHNPELFDKLYEEIIKSISILQSEHTTQKKISKK